MDISSNTVFIDRDQRAAVACERAVSELRFGRPVVLEADGQDHAVLSLDAASPAAMERFASISAGHHALYVTRDRARILGIDGPFGAFLEVDGLAYDDIVKIAYGPDRMTVPAHRQAGSNFAVFDALARTAQLLPAFVCLTLPKDDPRVAGCVRLPASALDEASSATTDFAIVARTNVPLKGIQTAEFVVFRGGLAQRDQIAIIVGAPDLSQPVPVRIHSSCITGDLFGSLKCDCGDQLREGLQLIEQRGGGILLYLDQEGRGTGIASKMRAYGFQSQGMDTIDADAVLGFEEDGRRYGAAIAMLRTLAVQKVELLTNNPRKISALEDAGFIVKRRTPVLGVVTSENRAYLATKANRSGHLLDVETLRLAAE